MTANACTTMRRVLVRHSTLSLASGESQSAGDEWQDGPCGTPLFTDAEKKSGTCRSCARGWTHPENFALLTCPKVPHVGEGHLHGEDHDAPYSVDGMLYCGRCHYSVNERTGRCERPSDGKRNA